MQASTRDTPTAGSGYNFVPSTPPPAALDVAPHSAPAETQTSVCPESTTPHLPPESSIAPPGYKTGTPSAPRAAESLHAAIPPAAAIPNATSGRPKEQQQIQQPPRRQRERRAETAARGSSSTPPPSPAALRYMRAETASGAYRNRIARPARLKFARQRHILKHTQPHRPMSAHRSK